MRIVITPLSDRFQDNSMNMNACLPSAVRTESACNAGGGGLVTKSCPTLAIPWTVACQAPLSMGFSRQEYWSGLPFPSPGDLPNPEIEPRSPKTITVLLINYMPIKKYKIGTKEF